MKYQKTLFKNKETGACEYLLDRIMGLESHVRMTEDAEAKMLEEAVDSSYRKGDIVINYVMVHCPEGIIIIISTCRAMHSCIINLD